MLTTYAPCRYLSVIEFQFRGLPHIHLLLILANECRARTAADVDEVVCAELPAKGGGTPLEERQKDLLRGIVLQHMVHNDCRQNPSRCRCCSETADGRCRFHFPKSYQDTTFFDENELWPKCRRRCGAEYEHDLNGRTITSQWIATYNPYLLIKYNCHLNVEIVSSIEAVKYLYKYLYKGPDRAAVRAEHDHDQIEQYKDMRYFGASEACWRLFQFDLYDTKPAVIGLPIHLDDEQPVYWDEDEPEMVAERNAPESMLLDFLQYAYAPQEYGRYTDPPQYRELTYLSWPGYYSWERQKGWHPRPFQNRQFRTIGRLPAMSMSQNQEAFYLRVLLTNMTFAQVQEVVRHQLVQHPGQSPKIWMLKGGEESFKEQCIRLSFADNDREWEQIMDEISTDSRYWGQRLADFFMHILMFNEPSEPARLFDKFVDKFVFGNARYDALLDHALRLDVRPDLLKRAYCLRDLRNELEVMQATSVLNNLPVLAEAELIWMERIQEYNDQPLCVQMELDFNEAAQYAAYQEAKQNIDRQESQSKAMAAIEQLIHEGKGGGVFLDAYAGSGKTYLEQAVLNFSRGRGKIAIAMASSGIASLLLEGATTFHSRMRAPLEARQNMTLGIDKEKAEAKLFAHERTEVVLLDEGAQLQECHLDALDRCLRDMRTTPNLVFGGLVLIVAGDL